MQGGSVLLKQGNTRCVRLEHRSAGAVIVKSFEQPGPLGRVLDASRARREYELLKYLSSSGVSVPRPLGIARRGQVFEVEMEWIEGARSLAELCRGQVRLSVELARRLGKLLADLHSSRVDHPDLHAGNVLITSTGRVVAVDFDKARIVRKLGDAQVERDLVSLCAGLRETSLPRWRAVALAAWWNALTTAAREQLSAVDPRAIELRARLRRLRVVLERQRRWTRSSSSVQPLESGRGFARAGATAEEIAAVLLGKETGRSLVRVDGNRRRVLALWRAMARLEEHGMVAPRCWLLRTTSIASAWFELQPERALATARGRGRWLGGLLDRGLWCDDLTPLDLDDTGLLRPLLLAQVRTTNAQEKLQPWLAALEQGERSEFRSGVGEVWTGPGSERAALLAQL